MGSGSRSGASVHLWSMLLGGVREHRLHHLSCLASSAILFTSTLCYCGTAGKQLPRQSVGLCVTWPWEANCPDRPPLHTPFSCSSHGSAGWWMVEPELRISWLSVIFHITMIATYLLAFFFSAVQFLYLMEKWSAFFFCPNSSEYFFPSCYLTPHV